VFLEGLRKRRIRDFKITTQHLEHEAKYTRLRQPILQEFGISDATT
jgi:hypothetical protein